MFSFYPLSAFRFFVFFYLNLSGHRGVWFTKNFSFILSHLLPISILASFSLFSAVTFVMEPLVSQKTYFDLGVHLKYLWKLSFALCTIIRFSLRLATVPSTYRDIKQLGDCFKTCNSFSLIFPDNSLLRLSHVEFRAHNDAKQQSD